MSALPALAVHGGQRDADWAMDVCSLAGSDDSVAAAQDLIDRLARLVPYVGAALCAFDPIDQRHVTVASAGYTTDVARYLNEGFVAADPAYRLMRSRSTYPMRWHDLPFDYEASYSARSVFRPAGFREGMSAPLITPDGRYTGLLHVSTDTPSHPSDHARETIHSVRSAVARIIDPLRRPALIAGLLAPQAYAAVVTAAGGVISLPGRNCGPLLTEASPLVARVTALLSRGAEDRRFLWEERRNEWHRVRLMPLDGNALVLEQACTLPHGITARELEILTAIAAGVTNAEMARRFFVAPRTVATHVEHLLEKLGCRSRAACAAIAVAEGLLLER
jgi:DNA-binding CsgD family transcriptional regulator